MKATVLSGLAALIAAQGVAAHATFQQLWVDGEDMISLPKLPVSNSPVTDVQSAEVACNANSGPAGSKCPVPAGSTVTVEMHQHNDRSCENEAIGGAHYGPLLVYMSKVDDAATADGSGGWFKVFEDTWAPAPDSGSGSDDYWGVKDLNAHCGRMDVPVPTDLAGGDYLLRAEVIALHAAGSPGGAQLYMTCYQLTVEGTGSLAPETVSFPGAYAAEDPGLTINIYQMLEEYVSPGPAVIPEGTTVEAGTGGSTIPSG